MAITLTLMYFPTDFPKRILEFLKISTKQFEKSETSNRRKPPSKKGKPQPTSKSKSVSKKNSVFYTCALTGFS